jgi:peptidase E
MTKISAILREDLKIIPKKVLIKKQIIALGGGGFSDDPGNPVLDLYIILQSNKEKPKVCFLPTASRDAIDYIERFYKAYEKLPAIPSHLSLTGSKLNLRKIESFIFSQDIIFAGGGSSQYAIKIWRKSGMDNVLGKAWRKGIILSGMSAGAMCWFTDVLYDPKDNNKFKRVSGLSMLPGSLCPHFNNRRELRKAFSRLIGQGEMNDGFGVEDNCALHFIGKELYKVVSSYPGPNAYMVKRNGFKSSLRKLKSVYLGAD